MEGNKIINESLDIYRKTDAYKKNKKDIIDSIDLEFDSLIEHEKGFINKYRLKILRKIKIYKMLKELTSLKKLYIFN
jgi:hypothetical protein